MSFLFNYAPPFLMNAISSLYSVVLDFTWPLSDLFNKFRPIIFLPFNIWFFFVSLPFRVFFFLTNGFMFKSLSSKALELKDQTIFKNSAFFAGEKQTEVPSITVTNSSPQMTRQRKVVTEDHRPFSWYSVSGSVKAAEPATRSESIFDEFKSQLEEIKHKKEEVMPKGFEVDQSVQARLEEFERREKAAMEEKQRLESQLDQLSNKYYASEKSVTMEKRRLESQLKELSGKHSSGEKAAMEEKQRLESQLKELTLKYDNDEKALAAFEADRARFKDMIAAQQTKSFDFQQDIIALKNQLKFEQESRLQAQKELDSIKMQTAADQKQRKADKRKSRKARESGIDTSAKSAPAPVEESKSVEATKSAWNVSHHEKDFTEMVAAAQRVQPFSEVVKESLEIKPVPKTDAVDEFTVVGGDLSNKHIAVEKKSVESTPAPVVESKPVESDKPAWNIPHHEKDFTEMVAAAQLDEKEHKPFSAVVKDSLMTQPASENASSAEFTVVGGDLSNKHVLENNAPSMASTN